MTNASFHSCSNPNQCLLCLQRKLALSDSELEKHSGRENLRSEMLVKYFETEAELTRLTALLEDRLEFAKMIFKIEQDEGYGPLFQAWETTSTKRRLRMTVLADRLIAYLKPLG